MLSIDDTIAAIATPIGIGGVGIIKISGDNALPIVQRIFKPAYNSQKIKPRYLHLGYILNPDTEQLIDEALIAYMPKPHSFTRQDVIEIQSHGGFVSLQAILNQVLRLGARAAGPGEMTLRAFVNGRLDLSQAEAVIDVIEAKTEASLRIATQQLNGSLSNQISRIRQKLVNTLAYLEATIDFVDEDIPLEDVTPLLIEALEALSQLIQRSEQGIIYRQGVRVAIIGRPNVGKSSLLNSLLRGERAIVTDIPGTTRDTLEETANLNGVPVILVDTAGIRVEPSDAVEQIGIERSITALAQADVAFVLIDANEGITKADWEIGKLIQNKPALLILNKIDISTGYSIPDQFLPSVPQVPLSAITGKGLNDLEVKFLNLVMNGEVMPSDTLLVSNPRHKALLLSAAEHTQNAIQAQQMRLSADLITIDIREAIDTLGEITGETATEDLLNTIFSKFCIGK